MKECILSVPHTGTRSLADFIGIQSFYHFGIHDAQLAVFNGHAHIPLRDPFSTAASYWRRYRNRSDIEWLFKAFEALRDRVDSTEYPVSVYPVEALSVHIGDSSGKCGHVPNSVISVTHGWIIERKMFPFFDRYYKIEFSGSIPVFVPRWAHGRPNVVHEHPGKHS